MERITKSGYKFNLLNVLQGLNRYADVDEILNRLALYEDTGLEPEEINEAVSIQHWEDAFREQYESDLAELQKYYALGDYDHLLEIVEAEKDGRLVVLPCKAGDTVWDKYGTAWEITQIDICPNGRRWFRCGHKGTDDYTAFDDEDIGEYVFLSKQDAKPKDTRSEAEAALEKRKEDKRNERD